MAYRRSSRSRTRNTSRSNRRVTRRRSASSVRRRSTRSRGQTVRLVIEQAPVSAVSRPEFLSGPIANENQARKARF